MSIRKIISKHANVDAETYVGKKGEIFFDPEDGELKYANGLTQGGVTISQGNTVGPQGPQGPQGVAGSGNGIVDPIFPHIELTNDPFIRLPDELGEPVVFQKSTETPEDEIDTGLTLARGNQGGLYNSESESQYDMNTHSSPSGTLWNSDGWGDFIDITKRNYSSLRSVLNNRIGENIIGAELIMWDTINDKFYKFEFSEWGQGSQNSNFGYTRTPITTPNYFAKSNYGNEIDIISEGLHITRGNAGWLYNPLEENSHDSDTPTNSLWNNDGWDALLNVESRTYSTLENIWGGNFSNIPGAKMILKDITTNKYWAIEFLSWTSGGNGGGFSYLRYELDTEQLQQGILFADGTTLKSATDLNRIKSTAPNNRRIEEITGYIEVSVPQVTTLEDASFSGVAIENPDNPWDIYLDRESHPLIDAAISEYGEYDSNNSEWRVSINGQTFRKDVRVYRNLTFGDNIIIFVGTRKVTLEYGENTSFVLERVTKVAPVRWFRAPGSNLRGAIIDFHAYSVDAGTIIGTIHIARDSGDYHITHTETNSGSSDLSNVDLWYRDGSEREIYFRRLDDEGDTVKIQWIAKLFYGSEYYD